MKLLTKEKIQLCYTNGIPIRYQEEISIIMNCYYYRNFFHENGVKGTMDDKLLISYIKIGKKVRVTQGKKQTTCKLRSLDKEVQYRLALSPVLKLNMWLGRDSYMYYEEILG